MADCPHRPAESASGQRRSRSLGPSQRATTNRLDEISLEQLVQVLIAATQAFKGRSAAIVALHEIMLHAGLFSGGNYRLPVDGTAADFSDVFGIRTQHLGCREAGLAVLKMQQLNAAAIFLQHRDGILASLRNPVAVHFEANQFGIRVLSEDIEARGVAELLELIIVIVETELHSQLLHLLAPDIELRGRFLEAVG